MNINAIGNVNWQSPLSSCPPQFPSNSGPAGSPGTQSDSVSLSSPGGVPGVSVGPDGRMDVNIDATLTAGDKALVTAATGGLDPIGPNGVHEVNQFAVTIALDRAMGNLTGPITASYLNNLKTSEETAQALNQQLGNAVTPGISLGVLDGALAYVGQQPENPPPA